MSLVILLDSGPLGLVSNPTVTAANDACNRWLEELLAGGVRVILPEIADYEVRRELKRAGRTRGLRTLDGLGNLLEYGPITTPVMRLAADLWAEARRRGLPTADPAALDADVILAAQALLLREDGDTPVVATSNPGHLARFVDARPWDRIP